MAKFSRTSTAYKQDGSVVAAGVPRFESNGVMVEEGTVNLIGSTKQKFEGWIIIDSAIIDLTQNISVEEWNTIEATRIQASAGGGTNTLKYALAVVAPSINGQAYTEKLLVKNNGSNRVVVSNNMAVSVSINAGETKEVIMNSVGNGTTTLQLQLRSDVPANGFDIIAYHPQAEAKPYATSFHPTARAAESLTIPASALNASEGTIEFDCLMTKPSSLAPSGVHWGLFAATGGLFTVCQDNGGTNRLKFFLGGWSYYAPAYSISWSVGDILRIRAVWLGDALKLIVTNKTTNITVSGSGLTSAHPTITSLKFSSDGNYITGQISALFSNLRISNKVRSDTELVNTGALENDEFTTYFCSFNGNLSATCHPVMLVQGQGQVLLSRVGRGTRSIKVQGSGQVKLKRSAQYYPTIAVGTKGKVQLSRQGIGYRSMKVEGQGSFKIQEPNIEIYPEIREREATTTIVERQSTTEVIGVPYAGDTIKIKGSFKTFEGVLADPASITLKIYDTINNLLTTINVTATNKISAGVYEVNYTIPDGYQALYYEWHCVQGDSPQVTMGKITVLKRGQA